MKTIKTLNDIIDLRANPAYDPRYTDYIEKYFRDLLETFNNYSVTENEIDPYNTIVLLEKGDDTNNIPELGISLVDSCPEYVNRVSFEGTNESDELIINNTLILFDNEAGITIISIKGTLDEETEAFLEEYIVE